jgi:hypothetical protein
MNTEADLQDALRLWQGDDLPADRSAALLDRLRSDASFRAEFSHLLWTLSLVKTAEAPNPRWIELSEEIGLLSEAPASEKEGVERVVLETIREHPVHFVLSWWRSAAFGALAAALLLVSGLLWMLSNQDWALRPSPPAPLATLVAARSALWKGSTPAIGSSLPAGRLELLGGNISVGFASGVFLFVEGPADFDLRDSQRIFCRKGNIRIRVPQGAEGFCVDTPEGVITDLGTELAIAVQPGANTRVAVFEGKAEASLRVPGQEGVRTQLLEARQGAELIATKGEIRPVELDGFLQSSDIPKPALELSSEYPSLVLGSGAALYWRLQRDEGRRVIPEIANTPALQLRGEITISAEGGGNPSALFRGGALVAEEPWLLPTESYALECWFCAEPMSMGGLMSLATDTAFEKHFAYLEFTTKTPGRHAQSTALRFLNRRPAAGGGGMNIFADPPTLTYGWHHLVAQQSRGSMELYLDGSRIGTAQAAEGPATTLCNLQFGVLREHLESGPPRPSVPVLERPYQGRLAELAIYSKTLAPAEITEHARQRKRP